MNTNKDEIVKTNDIISELDTLEISGTPPSPIISHIPYIIKTNEIPLTPCYSVIISSSDSNNTSDTNNTTSDSSNTSDTEISDNNSNHDTTTDTTDITTDNTINEPNTLYMIYNEQTEINEEIQLLNYHKNKDCGYWKIAKMIISHSTKDKNNTEFFLDSLDSELQKNNDKLENIEKVFYTNNLDIDIVYEFEATIATFIVENLKLFKFKPLGYLFNKDVNQNKWDFTISVITSKSIYTYNRYISENQLGFY